MKAHCAIYIRKSREDKNKPAHRLTVQREQLPAYAASQGWTAAIYDDGHASAAKGKTEALTQRSRLEHDIRANRIHIVLVIELSRLSRDDTLEDYLSWLNLCAEHHVKLATLSRTLDPAQHSDWMLLLMEGGFSSVEMKVLRGRMEEGRQQAFLEGKWLGGTPPPPYTYSMDQHRPVIDPAQLPIMQQLWQMAEDHSARAIAKKLQMPEIAVRRAISDERLLICQALRQEPVSGDLIQCDWEPVLDTAQVERIKDGRQKRRKLPGVRRHAAALLSNLDILKCGYCGRTVKTWRNSKTRKDGSRLNYYGCQVKSDRGACPKSRMIQQPALDEGVLTNLFSTLERLETLQQYWELEREKKDEIGPLKKELHANQKRKERLVDAVSEGALDLGDVKEKIKQLNADIATTQQKIETLEKIDTMSPDWNSMKINATEFDILTFVEQREFIKMVLSEIKVFSTYAILTYPFPRKGNGDRTARIHLPKKQASTGKRRKQATSG